VIVAAKVFMKDSTKPVWPVKMARVTGKFVRQARSRFRENSSGS
jgi:hypothetical protein